MELWRASPGKGWRPLWPHSLILQMGKLRPRKAVGIAQNSLPISGRAQVRIQVPDSFCSALSSDVTLAHSNNKDSVLSAECESGSAQCLLCVCVCVCVLYPSTFG